MDQALMAFRRAAARENRGRHGLQRRHSPTLQAQAMGYWHARQRQGDRFRIVAAALGVAHWTLHRWIKASKCQAGFQAVQVVTPVAASPATRLVIELPTIVPAWRVSMWTPPRSCWRCCDEMARAARPGLRVHAAHGHAERF